MLIIQNGIFHPLWLIRKNFFLIFLFIFIIGNSISFSGYLQELKKKFSVVTYVSDYEQERKAEVLVKSIRELSGRYKDCMIYLVLTDPEKYPCDFSKKYSVEIVPIRLEKWASEYPLAVKAFAAAKVEELLSSKNSSLAWFDPETIVLNSLEELDLSDKFDCAIRPVFQQNNIGQPPESKPNRYWSEIYKQVDNNIDNLLTVETIRDNIKIRGYFNCEVFSVNPRLGIFKDWAKYLEILIKDKQYQEEACTGFLQKLFLHQAVLSAVIQKRISKDRIRWLQLYCGYPFNLHDKMNEANKAKILNDYSCVIFEDVWNTNPNWTKSIEIKEPLKKWIMETYLDFLKVNPNIYRIEGTCNSYLVLTEKSAILIDPSGAASSPEWFNKIIEKYPLKAILLTHGHNDHRDNINIWKKDRDIPVIAQQEIIEYIRYQNRLAGFFARRNAIWSGKPIPQIDSNISEQKIEPDVLFGDKYSFEIDGIHFHLIHTSGETPDHTIIHIPELRSVFIGDNYYTSFPNIYTFRGTKTRYALEYMNALDTVLSIQPDYLLPGHSYPLSTNKEVKNKVKEYRDAIQYVHDETVKGINAGKDVYTLMKEIQLPAKYNNIGQFYGCVPWSVRGIYEGYIGWFDENAATMYNEPVSAVFPDLINLIKNESGLIALMEKYIERKEYISALHLSDIILSAEPNNLSIVKLKLETLKSLRLISRNYIERIWLDYNIKKTESKIQIK